MIAPKRWVGIVTSFIKIMHSPFIPHRPAVDFKPCRASRIKNFRKEVLNSFLFLQFYLHQRKPSSGWLCVFSFPGGGRTTKPFCTTGEEAEKQNLKKGYAPIYSLASLANFFEVLT